MDLTEHLRKLPETPVGTYGDAELGVDLVDVIIEADEPLTHAPMAVFDEQSARIGALVAEQVPMARRCRPVSVQCPTQRCMG